MFKKLVVGGAILMAVGLNLAAARQDIPVTGVGEVLVIEGQVLDVNGNPVVDAAVEIWQTDANGVYNHPGDTDGSNLLDDFQYFGTSVTDDNGNYSFRTIKPNVYEALRPPHIHVKVKIDGLEVLTTQFYFEEDRALFERDSVFSQGGGESLILQPEDSTDDAGNPIRLARKDLVVATETAGTSGMLPLTQAQTEGPYYPVVDFSEYDNDLTVVGETNEFTLFNLNTASADDFLTIPDVGNRMVREFMEYRPYISIVQFRREIGKYVDEAQVAAYEEYVYVPIDVNGSDAETLKQIPGVDDATADALMAARPYESNAAFLAKLAEYVSEADAAFAANFLVAE
jgi:protocatechuate 3,4-dioxygenase beta subunit